ncbi:serine/arginine repetitive matrix protein 4 [Pygocentrus nattereri]|uniref:Serine/arginine repetitive matrix protein C-terminal domain-containing protein n=1 Tax=Pygocentrus nattereri TaxID=42514 RepID=A0A3B4BWF1_PYGNA|nr:serine/arginine repetitive matrix protein 4 [Pygocentrus nattereri]
MATVLQGQKQLLEKLWKGACRAVTTPRPESVIIASIAARRAHSSALVPKSSVVPIEPAEPEPEPAPQLKATERKRRTKRSSTRKHHSRHRSRSVSFDADFSTRPAPKGKKKKKKERKRRRERSPSFSPSPVRKKKKKKKSSKKRKQHRSASKKRRHSSSSTRRKRKDDRKHKKRTRSDSHHRRRLQRVEPPSLDWTSTSTENRSEDHGKSGFGDGTRPSGDHRSFEWGSAVKLANKIPSKCCTMLPECSVEHSRPGLEALNKTAIVQDSLSNQGKGHAEYDSGNDTSSPPSTKTGISRAKVAGDGKITSPEKLRFTDRDNASDSGNSLTSYDSLGKAAHSESNLSSSIFNKVKSEEPSRRTQPIGSQAARSLNPSHDRYRSETRSRSRSRSSRSSRHYGRYSRSRSLSSSRRSYSRSSSYSLDSRRGSVCSGSSRRSAKHSRYTPDRTRERKRGSSSCEKQSKRGRKRSRRRACSPMRKRRRDSPSHLEARRITSARKRPIPYYRPSPSSSSSCSSLSSWSLFSLTRSPTRSPTRTRSRSPNRSRSRSRSSYRSYSRSSSWNSLYSSRSRSHSRSRSYDSLASRARR